MVGFGLDDSTAHACLVGSGTHHLTKLFPAPAAGAASVPNGYDLGCTLQQREAS